MTAADKDRVSRTGRGPDGPGAPMVADAEYAMLLERVDALIGFVTILALLSVLVTALAQATQSLLRLRGRNLQRGLELLLRQAMIATQQPGVEKPIGLMIVHGVGRQKAGATLQNVLQGLRLAYPDAHFGSDGDVAVMTLDERQVRLYEVHWAPVLSGKKIHGSFRLNRLQQLVWFPQLNHSNREDHRSYYPWPLVRRWTRILYPISMMVTAIHLLLTVTVQLPANFFARVKDRPKDPLQAAKPMVGHDARASAVDNWLADRLGDVFNYLDARVEAPSPVPTAHDDINDIFCKTLERVASECSQVQILAHSMGSLVTYDALSRYKGRAEEFLAPGADDPSDPRPPLTQLYTIGSPLEKILFFWPKAIEEGRGWQSVEWNNFRNRLDPISGKLESEILGSPTNHTVRGAGGLLTAHTGYRTHPTFLKTFGHRLTGTPPALSPGRVSRALRRVLDYGESALVYLALFGLAGLGAWFLYRLGKSIRAFLEVPEVPFSAIWDLGFKDMFLTLLPYGLGTMLVVVLILLAPLFARPDSEDIHRKYWQ